MTSRRTEVGNNLTAQHITVDENECQAVMTSQLQMRTSLGKLYASFSDVISCRATPTVISITYSLTHHRIALTVSLHLYISALLG